VVQELFSLSYSRAKDEVVKGHVTVNEAVARDPGQWVLPSDRVAHRPELPTRRLRLGGPSIAILYQDQHVVVVDKPAGLLVHPTLDAEQDTVLARTARALARTGGEVGRLFVVHRLDRDTSGVLVLARSHAAALHLQRQFRTHTVTRRYLALVAGDLAQPVTVARAIGRPRPTARRAALAGNRGQPAVTHLEPLQRFAVATLVEAQLQTGRTHQVRVHLSYLGHPVLGDTLYGKPKAQPVAVPRLALHAKTLAFTHPATGRRLEFSLPLPADLAGTVRRLRATRPRLEPLPPAPSPPPPRTAAATPPPPPRSGPPRAGAPGPSRVPGSSRRPRGRALHRP